MIEDLLRKNKLKVTKSRVLILNTIDSLKEFATIKNINDALSEEIDKSTIYRTIITLLDKKIIAKEVNCEHDDYFVLKLGSEHFIHCVKCHKTEILKTCPINKNDLNGYKIMTHHLRIDGICLECQKNI